MGFTRLDERKANQLRPVTIETGFISQAEGSVLVSFGKTRVICTASVEKGVPSFLRGSGNGWVTAEYGMLPRSTNERMNREAVGGKQGGRTLEIQRLIGRSLRAGVNLAALGENTIKVDCDVIEADGGTRTASITGACVALYEAIRGMGLNPKAFGEWVASVSVGVVEGALLLDLDYREDSSADTDMNVVMTESGGIIEIQGTAEKKAFSRQELDQLVDLASGGIGQLINSQKTAINEH